MQRSYESILVKMFTKQNHLIVKSLADMLIFGSEDPDKRVYSSECVCYHQGFFEKSTTPATTGEATV